MTNHINHQQAKQGIQQAIERRRYNTSLDGSVNNTIQNALREKIGLDTLEKDEASISKRLQENAEKIKREEYVDPKEYDSLIADAESIGKRIGYYRNYIRNASPDNAEAIKNATDMSKNFINASKAMADQQKFFSAFKDADDYQKQMAAYKEQQRLTFDYDLNAGKTKLDAAKGTKDYDALKEEYDLAKYYQDAYNYDKLSENEDFEKKSKKANSTWDIGETARAADYINGKWYAKAGDTINEIADAINIFDNNETVDAYNRYDFMTDDQVRTFNYIYNTAGQKKAQAYLDFIEGELARKYAEKNKTSNFFVNAIRALNLGTESIGEGLENLGLGVIKEGAEMFTGGKTGAFGKAVDSRIKENVVASNNALALAARQKDAGAVERFFYDVAQTTPTTLVNMFLPGGFVVTSLSAAGNAYADATAEDKNSMQRIFMAIGEGSMEALTNLAQAKLGGDALDAFVDTATKNMGKTLGKVVAGNFIRYGYHGVSEGLEEAIQEIAGTELRNVVYREKNDINWKDVGRSFLLGATSAEMLQSPNLVRGIYSEIKLPPPTAENYKETLDTAPQGSTLSERFSALVDNLGVQDTLMSATAIANVIEGNTYKAVNMIDDQIATYKYAKEYAKQKIGVKSDYFDGQISMLETMKKLIGDGKFNAEAARNATMQSTSLWQIAAENNDTVAKTMLDDSLSNKKIEKNILTDKGTMKAFYRLTGTDLSQYSTVTQKRNAVKVAAEAYKAFVGSDAAQQVSNILKANNNESNAAIRSENRIKAQKVLEEAYKLAVSEDQQARNSGNVDGAKVAQAKMKLIDKVKNDVRNGKTLSFASLDGSAAVNNARKYTEKAPQAAPNNTSMAVERDIESAERVVGDEYVKMFDGALSKSGSFNEAEKTVLDDIESRIKYAEGEEKNELIEQRKKLKEYINLKKSAHEETLDLMKQYGREEFQKRAVRFQKTLKQYGIDLDVENGGELYYDENKNLITEEKYNELRKQGKKTSVVLQNGIHTERTIKIFDALAFGRYIRTLDFETGEIVLRRSGLDFNAREGVDFVVGHELVHEGETVNSGIVKTILDSIANTRLDSYYEIGKRRSGKKTSAEADKHWNDLKELYIKAETKNGDRTKAEAKVTDAYMYEEIAADYMGMLLAETGSFDAVASKGGLLTKIKTVMKSLISRLKGDKLDIRAERVKELMKKLDDIVKSNYGKQAKTAENAQKSTQSEAKTEAEQTPTEADNRAENEEKMMVVGENAETVDLSALEKAKAMLESDPNANTVLKTGWWLGKDGKWRYEIADNEMRFERDGLYKNPQTLEDYIEHDKLFDAYPHLKNIRVKFERIVGGDPKTKGQYDPVNNVITLKSGRSNDNTKKTLIHEIQHAVQEYEGFLNGFNNSGGYVEWFNRVFDKVKNTREYKTLKTPAERKAYVEEMAMLPGEVAIDEVARSLYRNNYGELEAKATAERLDMTEDQRRESPIVNDGNAYSLEEIYSKFVDNLRSMGYTDTQIRKEMDGEEANGRGKESESATRRNAKGKHIETDIEGDRSSRNINSRGEGKNQEHIYDGRVKYSLSTDSDGRPLTEAQQEFFKDSKVRDVDGNLLVAYHGTDADFNTFDADYISRDNKLGAGFYFKVGEGLQYSYEHPKTVYLNITNPITDNSQKLTREAITEFCKKTGIEFDYDSDDYDLDTYERLSYLYEGNTRDFLNNVVNILGVDGVISEERKTAVAFSPNQVKNVDNANPTSDPDIRYSISPETEGVVETADGDPVAVDNGNGNTKWSIGTYEENGRDTLLDYLNGRVSNEDLSQEDVDDIMNSMDEIYNICRGFEDEYATFGAWSRAKVEYDVNGDPVFSVIKANGDYAMNLDFSLVCKKRRALDAVFNRLIEMGKINTFDFGQEEIVKINSIIRDHGFEVACAMCFVDAKRYRQAKVADDFVTMYNNLVKSLDKNKVGIDYFNYGGDQSISRVENAIDTLSDEDLDFTKIDKVLAGGKERTVIYKIADHLKNNPQDRKLLSRGDFMSSEGFGEVKKANPAILSLYNAKKGSGGPKATFGDVQYLNDVIKSKKFKVKEAYEVGGVRIQSFSDYVARLVFDYTQMVADLAAKGLPAHAYTKEALFVKQFGLTGIKINMSLIPEIGNGKYAGLNADGSYAWAKESFPIDEAFKLQADSEYGRNCGTIAVGVSDEHIRKLLSDPNIRMVIPYHKSGINPVVAHMLNIKGFTDYTKLQNTRYRNGTKISDADAKGTPNFNVLMHEEGLSPVEASKRYVEWCEENGYLPKFPQFAYVIRDGKKVFNENYYKLLEDFTTQVNGETVAQEAVKMRFPDESSAFGSMKELIAQGLEEDAVTAGKLEGDVDNIVDEISEVLGDDERGGRMSVTEAMDNEYLTAVENGDNEPSYNELKRELHQLKARNERLAHEFVKTHGKEVDRRSAMKLLNDIIEKYQGTIKARDLLTEFEEAFAYVNTKGATVDALMKKLDKIATDIFNSAIEYDDTFKEYSGLLTELRTTGITVGEQDRGGDFDDVGGWNEFRKKNFGSIKFVNDGKVMIDSKYQELATRFPELFDDKITHPAEQAKEIASVARRMRETGITPHDVYEGVDGQIVVNGIIGDLYSALKTADRKATFADKAAQKVDDAYLAEKMHYGAKIAELKRKSEMRERKIVEAFSTRMHKLKEDHHKAYQEKMVRSRVKDLAKRAARPTKTKHVPEGMKGDLLKLLSKITWEEDTIARSDYASEMRTLLADAPEHFTDENDIDGVNTFSEDLLKDMRDFSSNVTVEKMTAKQAYELNVLLMRMIHEINDADKIFHSTAKASTLATKAIAQFNSNRNEREYVGSSLVEFIKYGATDPEAFFNVLGIPVLTEAYHNLAKRQDVFARTLRDLTNDMAEITGGEVPKSWREEVHEYTLASGEKVRLTPVQKMTLYLLSKQEASRKRLLSERGGIVPTDTKREFVWHTKENGKEKIKLSVPKTSLGKLAHLTEGDITTLVGTLDNKQIDMANKISELLNGKCADLGNEVSLAEEGYRKFIVENYFPMMVAETGRTYEQLANSAKEQIAHKSFTKDRTGTAGVPLVVEDIFSVMDRHLLGMAQYYAYDEALRDFQRILRLRPEGQGSLELTMKGYFGNKGNRVNNFLSNFIKDVQGAQMNIGEESLISEKVLSTYKAAQVAGNLSVVAKQPTAIFRAMPEFSAKGMTAMMNFATTKADIREMVENSGLAQLKAWGLSENTTAKSVAELYDKNATNWRGKLDNVFSYLAEQADMITWAAIWRAAKAETKTIEEATAKFNDAIRKTQVVKSAFTSSRITEQPGLTKLAFAFKNEPLKTFNYIRSTINDVAEGKEGAKKKAFAVTVATAINTAVVAAISAGFSLIRDDEEDSKELFAEKFKENVIADLVSNSTIMLGDIWTAVESAMNGREVERMDLAVFTDATQFARNFIDMFKKPESEQKNTWMKIFYDGARTVSNFTGIPIGNVIRALKSIHGRVVELSDDPVARYNMTKVWYNVEGVDNAAIRSKFRSILTDALDEGNYKAFAEINNDLRRHGFSASDIEKAVSNSARLYNAWNNGAEAFRSEVNKAIKVAPMLSSTYIMEAFKSKKTALVNDLYDAMKSGSKKATNDAMSALLKHRDVDTKRVLTESDVDKLITKKIESSIKNEVKSRLADLYGTESYDTVKKKILNEYRHFEMITSDYIDKLARMMS